MLALEIKEYDHANKYFMMLYQQQGHRNQGAFLLAVLAYKKGENKHALDWFAKVHDKKYEYESILRMSIILAEDKQFSKAIEILDSFLAEHLKTSPSEIKNKKYLNVLRLKADILYQAELFNQAYNTYTQALKLKSKDAELLYSRAMVAEKLNKIDLSEQDLLSIIKDDPQNSNAFNALGFILTERTTRYDDARKYIAKALQITPNDMAILDSMGWVLYKMGHIKEALTYLKQAYNFRQDPEVAAHYGEALWAAGEKKKAKEIWQTALIDNPEHIVLKSTIHTYITP
jgi:tetratricopeptide (TPR) repeat protein